MGLPEPISPEDDDPGLPPQPGLVEPDVASVTTRRADFEFDEPGTAAPQSEAERPSWLVGAEEGTQADFARAEAASGAAADVKLQRPTAPPNDDRLSAPQPMPPARPLDGSGAHPLDDGGARAGTALPGLPLSSRQTPDAAAKAAAKTPGKPVAWTAAGSSVPRLTAVPAARTAPPTEADFEDTSGAASPGMADEGEALRVSGSELGPGESGLSPLHEPWWVVLGERLATERKLQVLVALAVILVVSTFVFWPHTGTNVSVKEIRRHPDGYEGQTVRVSGTIGEVFAVGQGYVYSLQQGRDTITVFARGHVPVSKRHVTVIGLVSTGYLDGRPRTAILEGDTP